MGWFVGEDRLKEAEEEYEKLRQEGKKAQIHVESTHGNAFGIMHLKTKSDLKPEKRKKDPFKD